MSSKVYKWCAVPLCTNTSIKTPNKLFAPVPRKKILRDKWLKLASRDPAALVTNSPLYFCEDHFNLPYDMENYMKYHLLGHVSQVRMKPGCIPTKFSCQVREIDRKRPNILKHKKLNVNDNEEYVKMLKESHMVTIEIDFEEASSGNSVPSKEKDQQVILNNRSKTTEKSNRAHMTKTLRSKVNGTNIRLIHQMTSPLKKHQHSVYTSPFKKNHVNSNLSKSSSKQQNAPGPSSVETPSTDPDNLDPSTGLEDPLATEPPHRTPQCRLCAEFSEDCVDVTDEDRPYLTRNKTTMTLNHLSVELDFNDALPTTVCRVCDEKLQGMFDFLKQVKEAQDSLNNFRDYAKEDDLVVKTECESPIPDDNCDIGDDTDDIDSKDYIVDSITETETVFVKPVIKHKRKLVEVTPKTHKKSKVSVTEDLKSENADFIVDIKEENVEMVDAYEDENVDFDDTEIDTQPSELELETLLRLMK